MSGNNTLCFNNTTSSQVCITYIQDVSNNGLVATAGQNFNSPNYQTAVNYVNQLSQQNIALIPNTDTYNLGRRLALYNATNAAINGDSVAQIQNAAQSGFNQALSMYPTQN